MSYRLSVPWTLGTPTIVPLPSFDSLVGEQMTRVEKGKSSVFSSPTHSDTKLEYVEEPLSEASIAITSAPMITPDDSASQLLVSKSGQDKKGQGTDAGSSTSELAEMTNPFNFPINQRKILKSSHYTRWYLLKTSNHPDFPPETPAGVVLRQNDLFISREVNETSQEKKCTNRTWRWILKEGNGQVVGMRWERVVPGETCMIGGRQMRLDFTVNGEPRWIQPESFMRKHKHRDATNSIL
ncbi:hypothetical protein VKT23_012842 [Stygiomarasmius scandens]|uniref:Uncharacterized protein n=1 Tax=Marasmiellus scandens TaxID=2682957 RepID=A0ABR1J9Y3_9AGAR